MSAVKAEQDKAILLEVLKEEWLADSLQGIVAKLCIPTTTVSAATRIFMRAHELKEQRFRTSKSSSGVAQCTGNDPSRIIEIKELLRDSYSVMVACLTIAHKYRKDTPLMNEAWGMVSNIDRKRLNKLEQAILELMDYRLDIDRIERMYNPSRHKQKKRFSKQKELFKKIFCF